VATLFSINPNLGSKTSRKSATAADGLLPPWLPPMTVYSDFLLWTRRRQIPAPPDFVLLVEMAVALGSAMNGKDL
jgi:hypothetical protein